MNYVISSAIRFASHVKFPWQYENPTHLPGGSQSVAHQFIRCVLHQLAPNGIFVQMFLTQMKGDIAISIQINLFVYSETRANHSKYTPSSVERQRKKYFKSIARALIDFNELNPTSPIHLLLESLNSKKTLPMETLPTMLRNMGEYLSCFPSDAALSSLIWTPVVQGVEALFRRLVLILNNLENPDYLLNIVVGVLKIPSVSKVNQLFAYENQSFRQLNNVSVNSIPGYSRSIL